VLAGERSLLPTQLDTLLQRLFPAKEQIPSLARDLTDDQRLVMSRLAEPTASLFLGGCISRRRDS
jgi:hypothetical protein